MKPVLIRFGIICEKQQIDDWLINWLTSLADTGLALVYIVSVNSGKSRQKSNYAPDKRNIDSVDYDGEFLIEHFSVREFELGKQDSDIKKSNPDVILNISSFNSPAWLAKLSNFGILQLDLHRSCYYTLIKAIIENKPTLICFFLMDRNGNEYIINQIYLRTIRHSVQKHLKHIFNYLEHKLHMQS